MSAGRQSCVIVSQRTGRADPNPPEGQPQSTETIILPEYYMVKRGEPTTPQEYQLGVLQFKALHPGEGVPPRNTGPVPVDYTPDADYPPQSPTLLYPAGTRRLVLKAAPVSHVDNTIYNSVINLVDCLTQEQTFQLLKHLAEMHNMEIE